MTRCLLRYPVPYTPAYKQGLRLFEGGVYLRKYGTLSHMGISAQIIPHLIFKPSKRPLSNAVYRVSATQRVQAINVEQYSLSTQHKSILRDICTVFMEPLLASTALSQTNK